MSTQLTRAEQYRAGRAKNDQELRGNSRDGVIWYEARIPARLHFCKVQTQGFLHRLDLVHRCACGAIRFPIRGTGWMDRNSRRRTGRVNARPSKS